MIPPRQLAYACHTLNQSLLERNFNVFVTVEYMVKFLANVQGLAGGLLLTPQAINLLHLARYIVCA